MERYVSRSYFFLQDERDCVPWYVGYQEQQEMYVFAKMSEEILTYVCSSSIFGRYPALITFCSSYWTLTGVLSLYKKQKYPLEQYSFIWMTWFWFKKRNLFMLYIRFKAVLIKKNVLSLYIKKWFEILLLKLFLSSI